MSALFLLAVPFLGFVGYGTSRRRGVALAIGTVALLAELALILLVEKNGETLGIALHVDGMTRLLLALLTLGSAATMILAAGTQHRALAPVPLLMLAALAGALIARSHPPSAVLLLTLALLAPVPALLGERGPDAPGVQRYLTVVILGGATLLLALALADLYRASQDDYLRRLVVALLTVGWGLLLGAFPFHFWLPRLCRAVSDSHAAALLGTVRPSSLAILLATFAATPWILAEPAPLAPLAIGGAIAALGCALLSLAQRPPLVRLAYLATADVASILVGIATGSSLGFAGALLATINHTLAMILLPASLALLALGARRHPIPRERRARWIGWIGIAAGLLALLGAPLGSGFLGRWMIYQSAWSTNPLVVVVLLASSALMLVGALRLLRGLEASMPIAGSAPLVGDDEEEVNRLRTEDGALTLTVVFGIAAVLAIGVYPAPLVDTVLGAMAELGTLPPW
jgi:formate hydrogenlyase subunit 3/multisubunit Na+/H+ antiporter MnhD subunit